ncbi:hypothetical protein F4703DRAFT_1219116 [Phycomyces blakesleeanus]
MKMNKYKYNYIHAIKIIYISLTKLILLIILILILIIIIIIEIIYRQRGRRNRKGESKGMGFEEILSDTTLEGAADDKAFDGKLDTPLTVWEARTGKVVLTAASAEGIPLADWIWLAGIEIPEAANATEDTTAWLLVMAVVGAADWTGAADPLTIRWLTVALG